jgi:hypothetical protein
MTVHDPPFAVFTRVDVRHANGDWLDPAVLGVVVEAFEAHRVAHVATGVGDSFQEVSDQACPTVPAHAGEASRSHARRPNARSSGGAPSRTRHGYDNRPNGPRAGGREGVRHAPGLQPARDAHDPRAAPGARKPPARLR